jgi:hypothetical protein
MLGQPPKDSARNIFIGGMASQKVIDTTISIPQNTTWYSDVIDLELYGALGVIATAVKTGGPSAGALYIQFSEDSSFANYITTYLPCNQQAAYSISAFKAGRYMRVAFASSSSTGPYSWRITALVTPILIPTISNDYLGLYPVEIAIDRINVAKSTDIPVPYRFPQTYSVPAGANTGRISIDLQNYKSVGIYIIADQNISITIEGSTDNTNWEPYATGTATANNKYENDIGQWKHRYLGITVTNNGSATATIKVRVVASKF